MCKVSPPEPLRRVNQNESEYESPLCLLSIWLLGATAVRFLFYVPIKPDLTGDDGTSVGNSCKVGGRGTVNRLRVSSLSRLR